MQMTIKNVYGYPQLFSITPSPAKGCYIPVTVIMVYIAIYNDLDGSVSLQHNKT